MPKIATPKETGHGGSEYESRVIAYFLANMLTKASAFSEQRGYISRVDFQVRADGWLFDDALLTINDEINTSRIAISIKSNQQFNNKGCSSELNRILWEQYLKHNTDIFNPDKDFLCIVQSSISQSVSKALNTLISQAKIQSTNDLHKRLNIPGYTSKLINTIYESMKCPDDLKYTYSVNDQETINLLRRFLHLEMDFENDSSLYESRSIDLCKSLLYNKTSSDGKKFFESLVSLVRRIAKLGGYQDIQSLLECVKRDFRLTGIPDYETDWKKLTDHSIQQLSLIQNKLGKEIKIDRHECIKEIDLKLSLKPICLIEGISGAGKTSLAKEIAEIKRTYSQIVWFDAADLDTSIEVDLHLKYDLAELFQFTHSINAYLFIDGAEKLFHERQQIKLALLISIALSSKCWKIIITCPSENVNSLIRILNFRNVNTNMQDIFQMPTVTKEFILNVAIVYPQLSPFLIQLRLHSILNNLKLFDKLLFHIDKISQIESQDITESELIDFIWEEEIENSSKGIQKSSFLKQIAEKQADKLLIGISLAEFEIANISPADDLKKEGIIQIQQQKIFFKHDLYAEWARYKLIESQSVQLVPFLSSKHLSSPFWSKAIRLYAISLLEKDTTGKNWKEAFNLFNGIQPNQIIIQNLFLEAFIFSSNSYFILNNQKDFLFENSGKFFKKLLNLFQNSATFANPNILDLAKKIGGFTETEASAHDRLPIIWYWPAVLNFIHENLNIALEYALIPVVTIATIWLEKIPADSILRKEAGLITLKAAQLIYNEKTKRRYVDSKIAEPVCKGLLAGFMENADAVSDLCLQICKRKKSEEEENEETNNLTSSNQPKSTSPKIMDMLSHSKHQMKQWEDGPFARVDSSFQKICLETNALIPLLASNLKLGKELLLALLINEPEERYIGMHDFDDDYEIHSPLGWYPPFFLRGPFLHFIRIHPEAGIDFIVRVINFATDRWIENEPSRNNDEKNISLNYNGTEKIFYSDFNVFGWVDSGVKLSHLLQSLLMVFEKFLVEESEKGTFLGNYVTQASNKTYSVAIIGILIKVGKIQPMLFLNELKYILPIYKFYKWDYRTNNYEGAFYIADLPKSWQEEAKKWNQKKRQILPLKDTLINLFLINENFKKTILEIAPLWQDELDRMKDKGNFDVYLFQMIPQFKRENYIKKEDNGNNYFEYVEPEEVSTTLKDGRELSLMNIQESNVSLKMEMMIDKELPFDLTGSTYLWGKIQQWANDVTQEHIDNEYIMGSPLTNALSSIGVLLHHEKIWEKQHPEYLDWIKAYFEKLIVMRLNKKSAFDHYGTDFDWNFQFASIVPKLWKKSTSDKSFRKMVAASLLLFNAHTVSSFFKETSKIFSFNSPEFIQVQNLFIQYNFERKSITNNYNTNPEKILALQKKYIKKFVNGNIPSQQMDWQTNFNSNTETFILKNLPEFKKVKDLDEKAYILFLLKQGLIQLELKLQNNNKDYPDDFDRVVLMRVAECIPYLSNLENSESYWEAILKFGYLATKWITIFCNSYFQLHIADKDSYPTFINQFEKMVAFSLNFFTWETKKSFNRHEDFRNCVIGFNPKIMDMWNNDYSDFIEKTKTIYQQWFLKNTYNPHTIESMIKFMVTKSSEFLLVDIFLALKKFFSASLQRRNVLPPANSIYVGHKDLDDRLASSLAKLWEQKKDLLKKDESIFSNYRELLQYLIAIENVIGSELQQRLLL